MVTLSEASMPSVHMKTFLIVFPPGKTVLVIIGPLLIVVIRVNLIAIEDGAITVVEDSVNSMDDSTC